MNPENVPRELGEMLDAAAGRKHSADGSVLTALAQILTRHRQLVLADAVRHGFGAYPVPDGPGFRVSALHAFLAIGDDGDEGVPAFQARGQAMPLIAADPARLASLRPLAEQIAATENVTIRLVRFTRREDIEVIGP